MQHLAAIIQASRPPFLLLTPICILLGVSTAIHEGVALHYLDVVLAVIGGVLAHISVNTWNEYEDFQSGLDFKTQKTPFSGGSGALIESPEAAQAVWQAAKLSMAVVVLIGVYFALHVSWKIIPIGLAGVFTIALYTSFLNQKAWLCLIAPGMAFGPMMVVGTHLVLTGELSLYALFASLVPFFMVNNLLLLNQVPDIAADKSIGRNHLAIRFGIDASIRMYGLFSLLSFVVIVLMDTVFQQSHWLLLTLIPASLMLVSWMGVQKLGEDIARQTHFLALNVAANLLSPLVLSLLIIFT